MSERVTWWRAFMGGNKRSSSTKDTTPATQHPDPLTPHTQGALATPHSAGPKLPTDQQPPASQQPQAEQLQAPVNTGTSFFSDETFDDSQFESVFNEQTCRRNLRVSRSGRFKEKKKVRSSLPADDKEKDKAGSPGKENVR